ncbi:hypothetical protein DAPPUDRAFT_336086 [Daphnia pulex]|uniref:Uncharacterized protein n=1 Tax=Daphnia pulex TaxID=6669 RepID=E9HZ35_DAPPU|nr:hypothetical protein DAPPUDRAFT_336086 [Daphnia pulex]|eukprot:EFX62995.1 hypothetical protein DAPPUDRAFT_336086 [Daphnia pulex]
MFEALAESIATSCKGFHNEDDDKEKGNDVADEKEKTCGVKITKLHLTNIGKLIAASLMANLVCKQIFHKMQWKRQGKVLRSGKCNFVYFIAILGLRQVQFLNSRRNSKIY